TSVQWPVLGSKTVVVSSGTRVQAPLAKTQAQPGTPGRLPSASGVVLTPAGTVHASSGDVAVVAELALGMPGAWARAVLSNPASASSPLPKTAPVTWMTFGCISRTS